MPLAEGLEELGIPFCGSANYWKKPDGSWLIRHGEDGAGQKADAVVVSTGFLYWIQGRGRDEHGKLPAWILQRELRGKVIGMDFCDGYLSPVVNRWANHFDIILRAHFNRRCWWPPNVRPWAYGLSRRILDSANKHRTEKLSRKGCLFAFGASHGFPHSARQNAKQQLFTEISSHMPMNTRQDKLAEPPSGVVDRLIWSQCAGRHNPQFFERLSSVQVCAAFCGDLLPAYPFHPKFLVGGNRAKIRRLFWSGFSFLSGSPLRLIQADSWRFWEALACGAAVLHHDADETGWTLPIPLVPFENYLPVSPHGENLRLFQVLSDESTLACIGQKGREWAIEHYAPRKAAKRLLAMLEPVRK